VIVNQRRPLHRRLSTFVEWIATEDTREETIRDQADEIRSRIKAKANDDKLVIRSTPWSGSFKKRTGLRRHLQGKHPIEGQDVDLAFVVSPKTDDDRKLTSLIDRFYAYAHASYPNTSKVTTKSSVKLQFTGTKLSYDLVPMLAGEDDESQIIIRADGEHRHTSVQKHVAFVTTRTKASNDLAGRVKFNECVRLFKWWREVVTEGEVDRLPSMMVDLLCASAFDRLGVQRTYPDTLLQWFGYLASAVERRAPTYFSDYTQWHSPPKHPPWQVVDPVNGTNNVAGKFTDLEVTTLAGWFSDARDALALAISQDLDEDQNGAISSLVPVFGNPILHHSGD
jgi:hypothetical protein